MLKLAQKYEVFVSTAFCVGFEVLSQGKLGFDMVWYVFLICSAACLVSSWIFAFIRSKTKYKRGRLLDPSKILFVGVILSAVILFIPIYTDAFEDNSCGIFETLLIAVHNMIRLFIVDGEFDFIVEHTAGLPGAVYRAYTVLFSILFVLAPLMTFGFVLSFFKNISAYKRYFTHFKSNAFIFSELNEKSLALAQDLFKNDKKSRIFVFTDVYEKDEEELQELIEMAMEIGAICFRKDIATVDFSFHSKNAELNFFAIGKDESENISQSLKIFEKMRDRENTNLYVFSTQIESEMLLTSAFNGGAVSESKLSPKIRVRRVNEVQSLISRTLFETGYEKIFKSAIEDESSVKQISALIVGMGFHGTEMTKALSWFCQMDGYRVTINAFDIDKQANDRFCALCPELMAPGFNGEFGIDGEAKYEINIHSGVDVTTKSFEDAVTALPTVTYVFISLGDDGRNISTAVRLRALFERLGLSPEIQAVVYDSDKKEALKDVTNFKNQSYRIDFIGDTRTSYSEAVILRSDVEALALKRHTRWGDESDFWRYDYNYRSSVASAIHRKMKSLCEIPGIDKDPSLRTKEELWAIRKLEHCRWNAYMRSEGYSYGGTVEKKGRNDLAKLHNCLVPFKDLPLSEQEKDDD